MEEYGAKGLEFESHERMTFLYRIFFLLIQGKDRFEIQIETNWKFSKYVVYSRTDEGVQAWTPGHECLVGYIPLSDNRVIL